LTTIVASILFSNNHSNSYLGNQETIGGFSGTINFDTRELLDGELGGIVNSFSSKQYGSFVSLDATTPKEGYVFLYWLDANKNKILTYEKTFSYHVLTNNPSLRAVYANSAQTRAIFVDSNGNPIATVAASVNEGIVSASAPDLSALPKKPGYVMDGWDQNLSNLVVNADNVAFVKMIYRRSTEFTTQYVVTVNGGNPQNYSFDQVATVTAAESVVNPDTQEIEYFSHWTIGGSIVSYNRTYKFTVIQNTNLIPVYLTVPSEKIGVAVISSKTYQYDYQSVHQVTFVGQYEIPDGATLIETGLLLLNAPSVSNLTHETSNVIVAQSSSQNENGEFTITRLSTRGYDKWQARGYVVYSIDTTTYTKYSTDTVMIQVTPNVTEADPLQYEDFEVLTTWASYPTSAVVKTFDGFDWLVKEVLLNPDTSDLTSSNETDHGTKMLRLRGANVAYVETEYFVPSYVARVSFDAKYYNESHTTSIMKLWKQSYGGTWVEVETVPLTASYTNYSYDIDEENVKIKITVNDKTANLDNLKIEGYALPDSDVADFIELVLDIPAANTEYTDNFTLPTSMYGATVSWSSNNAAIEISGGNATVIRPEDSDVNVTLGYTITLNSEVRTGSVSVIVKSSETEPNPEVLNKNLVGTTGSAPSGWTYSGLGSAYADGSLKMDSTGDFITTESFSLARSATFNVRIKGNSLSGDGGTLTFYDQDNNIIFTRTGILINTLHDVSFTISNTGVQKVKFVFTKTTGNIGVYSVNISLNP